MKAAILDATENENPIKTVLDKKLSAKGIEISYFKLNNLNLLPCRSCGSCGNRTPGKCVQKDDMSLVIKSMAESYLLVYISTIIFGGYAFQLKKVIDRSMPLGEPFYFVRDGHLLHPMRYGRKLLLGIGLFKDSNPEEEDNFRVLVARNGMNMQASHQTIVIHLADNGMLIENEISKALGSEI